MKLFRGIVSFVTNAPVLGQGIQLIKLILAAELSTVGKVNLAAGVLVIMALAVLMVPAFAGFVISAATGQAAAFTREAKQAILWIVLYLAGSVGLVLCGERGKVHRRPPRSSK
jgi:hypothetical protein